MTEARIDLHCHTSYSEDREQVALPHGASLTLPFHPILSPAEVFERAVARGMTHVTFTDHDTLDGCLDWLAGHGADPRFIPGEELTCYHAGEAVHVGVYGLTEAHHRTLHHGAEHADPERACLRWNLPELLAYLRDQGLPHDLKHPIWSRDSAPHHADWFRDVLGMFTLVEALNGTRHRDLNDLGWRLAQRLGRPGVAATGGSDSHTTAVGLTYTRTCGESPAEVLASLRDGRCEPAGRHGTHAALDADTHALLEANAGRRAGQFFALADDFMRDIPQLARELFAALAGGTIAYAVVSEYGRQRALARSVAELFEAELAEADHHDQALAAPTERRPVHGHLRRD